jgi:hypothetical protein
MVGLSGVLKPGIDQRVDCLQGCPSLAVAHAQSLGHGPKRPCDGFGVDRGKVPSLDQSGSQDRIAIPDLRDQMHIGDFPQRLRQGPAHKWDADPFRVGRFGNDQHARSVETCWGHGNSQLEDRTPLQAVL